MSTRIFDAGRELFAQSKVEGQKPGESQVEGTGSQPEECIGDKQSSLEKEPATLEQIEGAGYAGKSCVC